MTSIPSIPLHVKAAHTAVLHATRHHRNVSGVGLRIRVWRGDVGEWVVVVNLTKEHRWWHRKLPGPSLDGVPIEYQVIGREKAA